MKANEELYKRKEQLEKELSELNTRIEIQEKETLEERVARLEEQIRELKYPLAPVPYYPIYPNPNPNYDWLWRHGMELCFEYTRRYNNIHKCQAVIMDLTIDNVGFAFEHMSRQGTPHPLCIPDVHKEEDNAVLSYRRYYANDKKDIAKWEKTRPMPDWYASGAYKIDVDFDIMNKEFANLGAYDE